LDKDGVTVPFRAHPWQREYRRRRHTRNYIPKARQLGFSTEIVMENGDACVHTPNYSVGIIDLKEDDAWEKLEKFRFAWQNGPTFAWADPRIGLLWKTIHEMNPLVVDNAGRMKWTEGGVFTAGTGFTGRTPQALHWSEVGPLSAQRPAQARKIRRGSMNSPAPNSIIDIETTMEGPRVGVAFEICELALANRNALALRNTQWRLHFAGWIGVPEYSNPGGKPMLEATRTYFAKLLLEHGVSATLEEQAWYEDKKEEQKGEMKQQYPSVIEEALSFEGDRPRFGSGALAFLQSCVTSAVTDDGLDVCQFGQFVAQGNERPVWFGCDEEESWWRMWEEPREGFKYILSLDACTAEYDDSRQEMDKHAVCIVRAPAMDAGGTLIKAAVVGAIRTDDRTALDILARRIALAAAYYGNCMVIVEVNMHMGYCAQLREAGVKNIWRRQQQIDDPGRGTGRTEFVAGWKTTPSSKPLLIEKLDKVLREQELQLWCPRMLGELRTFQQSNAALAGQHDDWVIALAMAVHAWAAATTFHLHVPVIPGLPTQSGMPFGFGAQPGQGLVVRPGFQV
jgi:hypothetical protein